MNTTLKEGKIRKTSKGKQRKSRQYRKQGLTKQETAKKLKLTVRTVNKYDPFGEQKIVRPTIEQGNQLEESCNLLAAEGLLHKDNNGRFCIRLMGKRVNARLEELEQKAILVAIIDLVFALRRLMA